MAGLRAGVQRLLMLVALGRVAAAATCDTTGREAPLVTTLMAAPTNTSGAAWIVYPNCTVETATLRPDDDGSALLDCSTKNISRIESLPTSMQRLYFDNNAVTEADLTQYTNIIHIILAWCNLKTVDGFKFPSSLRELDLEGNQLEGIAKGTIPNRVEVLYLGENDIDSIANFSFPSSLTNLFFKDDKFTSLNFAIPDGLNQLHLDENKDLKTIENLAMPNSLTALTCTKCGLETFRGVQLSTHLNKLDFSGVTLTEFEIRDSDVGILKNVEVSGFLVQKTCKDASARLLEVQPSMTVCVISDTAFDEKYPDRLQPSTDAPSTPDSPAPTPTYGETSSSSSSSSSSSTIIIIIVVVVAIVCVAVAVLVYRKCFRKKKLSSEHNTDKYQDASTLDLPGSSATPSVRSASASVFAPQEYLPNDIRTDERLITYRIAYEEVQVIRELAKGGFGVIYLARFRGSEVAMKQMLPEKSKDMRVVRSFMDEIRLCASLEHPRVVEFVGLTWSTLQDMAVVIEYMAGGDLQAVLRAQPAPDPMEWFEASDTLKPKSSLALDIVDGLVYLHSFDYPIIHRDLKARNVLLSETGDAKLSDFGISREALLDETMTGEIGTVAWIAPEVLLGERYSEKADIYSLGVLLVELDTARHPYRREITDISGTPQSNTRIALLVSAGKLSPTLSPECPSGVAALISSCLTFDPDNRPSAMDVHYELRKLLQQRTG